MLNLMDIQTILALITTTITVAVPICTIQFFVFRLWSRSQILEALDQMNQRLDGFAKINEGRLNDINNRIMDSKVTHLHISNLAEAIERQNEAIRRLEERVFRAS